MYRRTKDNSMKGSFGGRMSATRRLVFYTSLKSGRGAKDIVSLQHSRGMMRENADLGCQEGFLHERSLNFKDRPADHGPMIKISSTMTDGPGGKLFPMEADRWAEVVGYYADGCIKVDVYEIDGWVGPDAY
ncbi:hypothetical protein EV424DRAFT_1349619 [Suillus variegatus]|nr:hypothetical protein EV424DRAFT_1349619 [Suillus variegatus]